ncbi:hypothetical protein AK830_g11013 [Neonectria ditissima]|uniref:Zn(2)-C6 fungal-type domain-containing protein n=1 Tax=Neonectria ditissima TaxID=78410 RepID=A0A0P7B2D6_9HYPO|nr:hypothetical protein AK830_g11013 [Neonectria ditissima]
MQHQGPNDRPYRSHLRPACVPCRRRKSRCQSEATSEICLMCRAHCTDCVFPAGPSSGSTRTPDSARRRRQTRSAGGSATPVRGAPEPVPEDSVLGHQAPALIPILGSAPHAPNASSGPAEWSAQVQGTQDESPLALGSADDQQHNLHIVGPAVTSDNQVLSDYLSAMPGATRGSRLIIPVPGNRSQPVLFTMVQKRPLGMAVNRSPSAEKLEMIERLLEPFEADVIDLSPVLRGHRCPERRFIWNLASEATYSELHVSPGMSIIGAILLNVGGRPTTSLIGNGVLLGSAVAMAHSLGLHHNPIPWEIPESEKYLRMKIWWALWVHDKWTSLAHGTPPHISRTQFNVPKPTIEYLCEAGSAEDKKQKASVFVALVGLTDVLDLSLRHIYHFEPGEPRNTTHLELALNNWVESLDDKIRRIIIRGTNLEIPGAANLRLAYLNVRLLLERIKLEADKQLYDTQDNRLLNRYIQARRTSEEILILTQELQPEQLADFWLPSGSFAFPATVSFLLRCALETENSPSGLAQSSSLRIASNLISALRSHKEMNSWDLGDICLAQHAEIVEKVLAMVPTEEPGLDGSLDLQDFIMPDVSVIDQYFPSLWDPLQSAW